MFCDVIKARKNSIWTLRTYIHSREMLDQWFTIDIVIEHNAQANRSIHRSNGVSRYHWRRATSVVTGSYCFIFRHRWCLIRLSRRLLLWCRLGVVIKHLGNPLRSTSTLTQVHVQYAYTYKHANISFPKHRRARAVVTFTRITSHTVE